MPRSRTAKAAAVIDASCLICLWHLDLLPKLVVRYDPVYIPRYVLDEVRRKGKRKHRLQAIIKQHPFLEICDVGDKYAAQLLYDRRLNPQARIDRGEAEAIIQGREREVSQILIDEKKGRKTAEQHSLNVRGTLSILKEFQRLGFIAEVKPLIEILQREQNFRISGKLLKRALEEAGEE